MHRTAARLLLVAFPILGCEHFRDKPAETPVEQPEHHVAPPGPLPPEEQPPAEQPPSDTSPPEAKPVEPGITSTGAPTRGKLPKAVIDEKLKSAQPGIQACYEAALKTKPDLRGSVNINFVVAPDGKVAHAEVAESEGALTDAKAVECILGQIKKLEFPEPSGGRVFLNYPLQLEPPK